MNAAGLAFLSLSSAPVASSVLMSSSTTGIPAFAQWAAMPLPITPAPSTATRRIGEVMRRTIAVYGRSVPGSDDNKLELEREWQEQKAAKQAAAAAEPPPRTRRVRLAVML